MPEGHESLDRPLVAVLLPTYNGARYLTPLLDSLEGQAGVRIRLHTLDDGSADGSRRLVDARATSLDVRRTELDSRRGVPGVFLELLRAVGPEVDFVAYCDQDDVWAEDKLAKAAAALRDVSDPALYACGLRTVHEEGASSELPDWMRVDEVEKGLNRIILGNAVPGCTMVMNRSLAKLLRENAAHHSGVLAHDWYTLLVAMLTGTVVVDRTPLVSYRLHDQNAVGIATKRDRLMRLVRNQMKGGVPARYRQLEAAITTAGRTDVSPRRLSARALAAAVVGRARFGSGAGAYFESVARALGLLLLGRRG